LTDGSDASSATQLHHHDTRYYTETELDAGQLDNRYFTETELGLTTSGSEGATLIGSNDVANLVTGATNVQLVLEAINSRFQTNPGNPASGAGISGPIGAFCLDTTNDIMYYKVDTGDTDWMVQ